MACKLVAYYRVSTNKQGEFGLGMDAQRADVARHVAQSGCELIAEYTEVESSWRNNLDNRPELAKAILHARRSKATLVIAKLDRLARNVFVTSSLMETGVDFVCCDNPHANRLTIHIIAAMNEDESRRISSRTKAAMAQAKLRGKTFGRPENLSHEARLKGASAAGEAHRKAASEAYTDLVPLVCELRASGASLDAIAEELNRRGHTTRRQRPWSKVQVGRVLARCS